MSTKVDVPILVSKTFTIVSPELKKKLDEYRWRLSVKRSGYPVLQDWHPAIPKGWGEFPKLAVERSVVYRGNAESWAYSHHHTITKFNDKYVVSWSNGFRHEDYPGQEVHYACSDDGTHWSEPRVLVHTPKKTKLVRNNAGLYADERSLYCFVCVAKDFGRETTPPGMVTLEDQSMRLDVYKTTDLVNWEHYENIGPNVYLFEGPRQTLGGKLICCGCDLKFQRGMLLIWNGSSDLTSGPDVVQIPSLTDGLDPSQGSWYQTDDGRIWLYLRDESGSCRLALTFSDDEGESWSELVRTDFPNSTSRTHAGRLNDGRYYIVGNNYDVLLDRKALHITLSDDGRNFDRQYVLVEGHTTRRINGRHKEDGYHYPNCYTDGNRLFVVYSVNKEDIEVVSVDMSKVE